MSNRAQQREKAVEAYRHARDKMLEATDLAIEALEVADLVTSKTSRELFERRSAQALLASENWRKAAELAQRVVQEIDAGLS